MAKAVMVIAVLSVLLQTPTTRAEDPAEWRRMTKSVLEFLEPMIPFDDRAVELLMLTAAIESRFGKFKGGPCYGPMQITRETERYVLAWVDEHESWLRLKLEILNDVGVAQYQTAVARILYWIRGNRLTTSDVEMGRIWKEKYNTVLGVGKATVATQRYREANREDGLSRKNLTQAVSVLRLK